MPNTKISALSSGNPAQSGDLLPIARSGPPNYSVTAGSIAALTLASPAFTGTPTAPTPTTSDNSTALATTAFVKAQGYGTGSGTVNSGTTNQIAKYASSSAAVSGDATLTDDGTTLVYSGTSISAPQGADSGGGIPGITFGLVSRKVGIGAGGGPYLDLFTGTSSAGYVNFFSGNSTTQVFQISMDASNTVGVVAQLAGNQMVAILGRQTTGTTNPAINLGGNAAGNGNFIATSGTQTGVAAGASSTLTFAPTSGTASFVALSVLPVINQTGGANGSYTAIKANVTETAAGGSANRLIDLQVGSTSKFAIDNTGKVIVPSTNTTTSATAGSNGAAPLQVVGYLTVNINGTDVKIPYYAV